MHCYFSGDSDAPMVDMIEASIDNNLAGITFTEKYITTLLEEMTKGSPKYYYITKKGNARRCYPVREWLPIMKTVCIGGKNVDT